MLLLWDVTGKSPLRMSLRGITQRNCLKVDVVKWDVTGSGLSGCRCMECHRGVTLVDVTMCDITGRDSLSECRLSVLTEKST